MSNAKSIRRALMIARPGKAEGGATDDDGFTEALKEGFGDRPLGLPPEVRRQTEQPGVAGAINQGIVNPAIAVGDAVLRGANAGVYGAANVARRAYDTVAPHLPQQVRENLGTGQQIERDIRDMPNAFMGEINAVPRNAAQTAVNIARKPAGPLERGMINVGSDAAAAAPEPNYFSSLERGIADAKVAKASPQDWKAIASKFPKEEIDWRGLNKFLDEQKGPVTKDQVLKHLTDNPVEIQEVWKGKKPFTPEMMEEFSELTYKKNRFPHQFTPEHAERLAELTDLRSKRSRDTDVKYADHQLPGGENYKEMLLTLPSARDHMTAYDKRLSEINAAHSDKNSIGGGWASYATPEERADLDRLSAKALDTESTDFKPGHFDEPNILAHVRMNDRTGPDGQKLLHVEEIQSDWHQKGKGGGYRSDTTHEAERLKNEIGSLSRELGAAHAAGDTDKFNSISAEIVKKQDEHANALRPQTGAVPDAPFKDTKDWTALALKRVMRYAADNGYDGVTWTTGAQQADRYDLGHHLSEITANHDGYGRYSLTLKDINGKPAGATMPMRPESLVDHVGKDMANKISEDLKDSGEGGNKTYSGLDLKVGSKGMETYYDNIVPSVANKLGKQHGAQVGKTNLKLPVVEQGKRPIIPEDHVVSTSGGYTVRHPGSENMGLWETREEAEKWLEDARLYNTEDAQVHHLPITPSMKGKAHKMFQRGGRVGHAPSEAQKEAGNYKKEHVKFHGLDIAIENKKGSTRSGKDASGKAWSCTLPADYGYIKRTEGADGDHVDVYIGPDKSSQQVFIVNQNDHKTGKFDEHKCMLGYNSERAAVADYCKAFSDGKCVDRIGSIETISMDAFKRWLASGKTKKPATSRNIVDHALKLVSNFGPNRSVKRHV